MAFGGAPEKQLGLEIGGGLAGQGRIAGAQALTVGAVAGGTGGDVPVRQALMIEGAALGDQGAVGRDGRGCGAGPHVSIVPGDPGAVGVGQAPGDGRHLVVGAKVGAVVVELLE